MKTKIAFIIYRKWAYEIFNKILNFQKESKNFEVKLLITTPSHEFSLDNIKDVMINVVKGDENNKIDELLKKNAIDLALFYGWSWMVKKEIVKDFLCLCLHPSPLPKYRGGSPIQNQIINGEKNSAVTVFRMTDGIDNGDIYMQKPISLRGDINHIFRRMVQKGSLITKRLINDTEKGKLKFIPQKDLAKNPPSKRRLPEDSKIKLEMLKKMNFVDVNNLIRGLLFPYPNAYILVNSKKINLQKIKKVPKPVNTSCIIKEATSTIQEGHLFLKLSDCYAKLVKYKIEDL